MAINKCIILGRLTKDPEVRQTQGGTAVATFTVAVDRRFKNAQGEREADFIQCVAWRQQAELLGKYFSKGHRIGIVGSIQTRNYEGNDGKRVYVTEVVVDEIDFIETRADRQEHTQDDTSLPFEL